MRLRLAFSILTTAAMLLSFVHPAVAQGPIGRTPRATTPKSSQEVQADIGRRAHTHILILGNGAIQPAGQPSPQTGGPPFPGYFYETPASLACIYNLVHSHESSCNPNVVNTNPGGGSRAIAIVDAFDDPNAVSDLTNFSAQFGLPLPTASSFQVVYAYGTQPPLDPSGGWELEESLDIEYAHAMAPNATLYLVEAASNSFVDLLNAEIVAAGLVAAAGGGEVSNSWGGGEFSVENLFDFVFTQPGVVYFASTGDSPGTIWPSTSPNVVAVGGTSTNRDPNTGRFLYEGSWTEGGGGPSLVEPRPNYQNSIRYIAGSARVVPDVSADANPNTGVWVLDTNLYEGFPGGWFIVGGTSVSSPVMAGIVNAAGSFSNSSAAELSTIYSKGFLGLSPGFNDIRADNCGPYGGYLALLGYDFCTGVGSPNGYKDK
ncbi:MAG TPA: S53 family peptidase [Candidatus Acidoferrales bacterium]|nr:S53 family peptidase [Candidatus Acidoferrales bacterium]